MASLQSLISWRLLQVCFSIFKVHLHKLNAFPGQSAEAQMLIASLRDVIRQQSVEIEDLNKRLKDATTSSGAHVGGFIGLLLNGTNRTR